MTPPPFAPGTSLGPLADEVEAALGEIDRDRAVARLWARDHTLWADGPGEIADRLGWLTVAGDMLARVPEIEAFAAEAAAAGVRDAVLLGMGGSSLAAGVFASAAGGAAGRPRLTVLDTTDPAAIAALRARLDLDRTLFVAASKSGTTIETVSHLAYCWGLAPDGARFAAVTDPGTPLAELARERGFRRLFENPPDVGGRYSALSYFGLAPAALAGADAAALLRGGLAMAEACRAPAARNPGALLGAAMGAAARAGRDKLTLVLPPALAPLGGWIEQLVAESTGKDGRGVLPVEGEPIGPPGVYGADRLFVALSAAGAGGAGAGLAPGLEALARAGHPVVALPPAAGGGAAPIAEALGGECFRWEFATAVACRLLGVHPFDQPNVQQAKDATARILGGSAADPSALAPAEALAGAAEGGYVALQAFLPPSAAHDEALAAARLRLRERHRVAVTAGYGPRFLHSTGQLHKGGPARGVFVQIAGDDPVDVPIPGAGYGFARLKQAQALGDLDALRALGRPVARIAPDGLAALGA